MAVSSEELDQLDDVVAELATIDAADSEIVLARAIELSSEHPIVAEQFPVAGLEQVAAELHVPVVSVADALAEYRAGGLERPTTGRLASVRSTGRDLLDKAVGPGAVKVHQRTDLPDEEAAERLSDWLRRRHRLRIRVDHEGTVIGVRRRGVLPIVARTVRSATGTAGLAGAKEVRAAAVTADQGPTSLCLVVDVRDQRAQSVAAGTTVAAGGALVVSAVAVVAGPATLVGVPIAIGAGWATSRFSHRYRLRKVTEEAELTADRVAAGSAPPTIVNEIGDRLGTTRKRR